jgi:Holliday junction resolvasome RuvABC endonuclease subunit
VRVGSLDPGSVSFGWGIVEFAPTKAPGIERSTADSLVFDRSSWLRVPRPSKRKNCIDLKEEAAEPFETLEYAFRLVEWHFESMCETKKKLTKEQAVALAVPMFKRFLERMHAQRVEHVVIEQQLGMQNMMTTSLAHVFQGLCLAMHPSMQPHFVAPQLTVPLFVNLL